MIEYMVKRLAAICFIFICTTIAWMILGTTIYTRTSNSGRALRDRVQSIWGAAHVQQAPFGEYLTEIREKQTIEEKGVKRVIETTHEAPQAEPPSSSDIRVSLQIDYRQKGLLWYSTYKVGFAGEYEIRNDTGSRRSFALCVPLPASDALYDDLLFTVDGQPAAISTNQTRASTQVELDPGQTVKFAVSYRSQGLESWRYGFGQNVNQVSNFHLRMTTDFKDIDFPDNTLSPGEKRETSNGWILDWTYKNLLSGYQIAMAMPEKLQPGPLAAEISYFAPVSLFFFFFVLFLITTQRAIDLHPMNYFFLAAAFFAFHLLLAYLVDHIEIRVAFAISSAVSIFLVATYLRVVVGTRFAIREAAAAQFLYLVLFSFAFFFKGFTGLAVTIGSIITLYVGMQMTGRVRWSERFAGLPPLPRPPLVG